MIQEKKGKEDAWGNDSGKSAQESLIKKTASTGAHIDRTRWKIVYLHSKKTVREPNNPVPNISGREEMTGYRKNGLYCFSRPMVVSGPWPQ